jgi:hypothetical protein
VYITLTQSGITVNKGVPSLERMQEVVGGNIETVMRIPSDVEGVDIDIFANEDGNDLQLPVHYYLLRGNQAFPIRGNLIATGGRLSDGETVSLSDSDLDNVMNHIGVKAADTHNTSEK